MTSISLGSRGRLLRAIGSSVFVSALSIGAPGAGSGYAQAMISAPPVYPYEQAYLEARLVVVGDIVAYDIKGGASLKVSESVRGDAQPGAIYRLGGSAGYSFLSAMPKGVVAFAATRDTDTLHLWREPTSGGLIWSDPGLLGQLARAQADPYGALRAEPIRERLAAAYFLMTKPASAPKGRPSAEATAAMVDSAAWGLRHGNANTNQAAVDVLAALGFPLQSLGIDYHPFFKDDLKDKAAAALLAWWSRRR